jgi:hypothetical protein
MRRLTGLLAASAITFTPIALAAPAQAATATATLRCDFFGFSVTPNTVAADSGDDIEISLLGPFTAAVTGSGASGPASISSPGSAVSYTVTTTSGGSLIFLADSGPCNGSSTTLTFTGSGGGGGGGSSTTTPPAAEYALGFDANGGNCSLTSSGPITNGVWTQVPTTQQCTRPGHTLLGWNPRADGGDPLGFDPGGWTVMTGDNTLYAIWVPIR